MQKKIVDSNAPKYRGTIIADAVALINLNESIDVRFLKEDPQRGKPLPSYVEGLKYLARQGYEVLIPEMIALECTDVLASGKSIHAYFNSRPLGHGKAFLRTFMQEVARGEIPNIRIVPAEGPEHVKSYIDKLGQILTLHTTPSGGAREALIAVRSKKVNKKRNFGDDAIVDLVAHMQAEGKMDKPVFVFSNDDGLLRRLEPYDVNVTNIRGILRGLVLSKIHTEFGMKEDVELAQVDRNCKRNDSTYKITDTTSKIYADEPLDTKYHVARSPFQFALMDMAKELKIEEKLREENDMTTFSASDAPLSRIDAWRARYREEANKKSRKPSLGA